MTKQFYGKERIVNQKIGVLLLAVMFSIFGMQRMGYAPPAPYNPNTGTRSIAENTASGTNIGAPVTASPGAESKGIFTYTLSGTDAASFAIDMNTGQLKTKAPLDYETKSSYTVIVTASEDGTGRSITITITVTDVNEAPVFAEDTPTRAVQGNSASGRNVGSPVSATDPDKGDSLTYTLGGAHASSFTVDNSGQLTTATSLAPDTYSVEVTAADTGTPPLTDSITVSITASTTQPPPIVARRNTPQPTPEPATEPEPEREPEPTPRRRTIVYQCPVGWQKQNTFGQPTPKVFIRSVEVDVDRHRPSGLYKPVAIEIYADPTEGLSDLAGWKLTVAVPYNHGREYLLTAENAVFNAEGIARIESPDTEPFPMTTLTHIGQVLPGFDYRLFSEKNTRVDFAISCYKGTNATLKQLEAMESPRVVRGGDPTSFEWDDIVSLLSKWRVPVAETAPAAPSLSSPQRKPLTTMWGALKKR